MLASPLFSIHLPASLGSGPVTALLRYYGRSDSCSLRPGSARAFPSGHPFGSPRAGLPDSHTRPSDHSVSNHLRALRLAKARYLSADRTKTASPRDASQRELGASPFASRLATPRRPNRVRYPTDWPFTSCCSPPRLATTQLQSATSYVDLERTFTSPTKCALRRTSGELCSPCVRSLCRGSLLPRAVLPIFCCLFGRRPGWQAP